MTLARIALVLVLGGVLTGCGDKPQTASTRKGDVQAFEGGVSGETVPGWKVGDAVSWEAQMKNRAQGQNEYSRASAP